MLGFSTGDGNACELCHHRNRRAWEDSTGHDFIGPGWMCISCCAATTSTSVDQGLKVESKDGDFVLPKVNAYGRAEDIPPCDVALVALKTTQNHLLPALLPPVLKEDGIVLIIQNGLGMENAVAQIVGPQRVMGGLSFLCSNKVGPGHIRHLDYGAVAFAEYSPEDKPRGITDRMRAIGGDFERAGIEVELIEDLILARWKKLVWNIPYSGLSVVLNATTDELMNNPVDPRTRREADARSRRRRRRGRPRDPGQLHREDARRHGQDAAVPDQHENRLRKPSADGSGIHLWKSRSARPKRRARNCRGSKCCTSS